MDDTSERGVGVPWSLTKKNRRIIQIASGGADGTFVHALCDDGSLWRGQCNIVGDFYWEKLPDVPQT